MSEPTSPYRAAFDDGVSWSVEGSSWHTSGWAFAEDHAPFDLELQIGDKRYPLTSTLPRGDVAAGYGPHAMQSGFTMTVPVTPGTQSVRLSAFRNGQAQCLLERMLIVVPAVLRFNVEAPAHSSLPAGVCRVAGWCVYPGDEIYALFVATGTTKIQARYGLDRADVAAVVPGARAACGFEAFVELAPGRTLLTLEVRLCNGALVTATVPRELRLHGHSMYRRVGSMTSSIAAVVRRGYRWRRTRGRWPHPSEWPRLLRRVRQEIARTLHHSRGWAGFAPPIPVDRYDAWLAVNAWSRASEERLLARLARIADTGPVISVVVPVYNARLDMLSAAVNSVRAQIYVRWELCIADDASTDRDVVAYLRQLAASDGRIRLRTRTVNGNISAATNDAASLASGDFLLFLDQDDVLALDCLGEIALAVARDPLTDIVYSDDDKVEEDGRRHSPQFKPGWSPELLLSYMYVGHALAIRRSLFEAIGGMRSGFEGSQDHDLALRAGEAARRVIHVPRILYHWRVTPGSTARRGDAKRGSFDAGARAVVEAIARRGLGPCSVLRPPWAVRSRNSAFAHEFGDDGPDVAIIVFATTGPALRRCLHSLAKTTYRNYHVLVMLPVGLGADAEREVASCGHRYWRACGSQTSAAQLRNTGADHTSSEFVLFLDDTIEIVDPRWLGQWVGFARLPGVGAVGGRLLTPERTVRHAGWVLGMHDHLAGPAFAGASADDPGYMALAAVSRNCTAPSAACMLTARAAFRARGGFDESAFPETLHDLDYGCRLLADGLRSVYVASADLVDHAAAPADPDPREIAAFRNAYPRLADPYFSPHLSLDSALYEPRPVRVECSDEHIPVRALMCCFNLNWEGAPYSQFEMTRELSRRGVLEPVVFSPSDGPLRAAYEEAGISVHVGNHPLANCSTSAEYDVAVNRFEAWIRTLGVSVVYGNTLQTFYAIDAARRAGLPSIWNPRESEPWREYFRGFGPDLEAAALRCFEYPYRVIFVAHATARCYAELDSHHNFTVIHNGLDPTPIVRAKSRMRREEVRRELDIAPDEVAILLLGTVCERKGQLEAVAAWELVSAAVPGHARLFIVGDRASAYSSAVHARHRALPIERRDRVRIVEETGGVASFLGAADVFLCTSRVESYPRVILEAMAWGLPIVTTRVFGIAEQVRPELNALVYEPGDAEALARQLERIVLDPVLRARLAGRAADVLASLSTFEDMVNQYAEIFRETSLLAGREGFTPAHALPRAALTP
jgi:glycosyltransferase involved in cell wall biosynthesis/GT2 family glycosyltransferase